jgi:predicted amino acid dehydrogenase
VNRFGFIIHPIDPKRDVKRKFPLLGKILPAPAIDFFSRFFPPVYISHITGARSAETGREIEGWFVACPFTPQRMLTLPVKAVYSKIVKTARLAQSHGAQLVGLGAFTSVVGDAGVTIASQVNVPVTTGDSYTVAIAHEAVCEAARRMEINLSQTTVAVVGATGAIGAVSAQLLVRQAPRLILIGKRPERLAQVKAKCEAVGAQVHVSGDIADIRIADVVLTVSSASEAVILPHHLKSGAVVCDVARPRDVSRRVVEERDDVLVVEGGIVEVPGEVDFRFDFGFPSRMAYACMAETMALAMDNRCESYTLGKDISISQVETIDEIARRHGFRLGGFRSVERAVTDEHIESVKRKARMSRTVDGG